MAHNLTRAAGALAPLFHAKPGPDHPSTIYRPVRPARPLGSHPHLHLPQRWPWQHEWQQLFDRALHDPPTTA